MNIQTIKNLAAKNINSTIEIRRKIHANPELSGMEKNTNKLIQKELSRLNIEFKSGYSKYGIVARIEGKNPASRTVALRADMDALPITEATKLQYASKIKGVMHACGHDIHTACLLGAAKILQETRKEWQGTVLLVFQPSEEKYGGGADVMLKEKALQAFGRKMPQRMYALHVSPELSVGTFGFKSGQYMASTDEIYITVSGRGGHAALPKETTNTVLTAAQILVGLQEITKNRTVQKEGISKIKQTAISKDTLPAIITFGRIIAGGQTNVIPDNVEMAGTLRTFDEKFRSKAHKQIVLTANKIARRNGAVATVKIDSGYPSLYNTPSATMAARKAAENLAGKKNVVTLPLRLTAEDFAFFAQKIPSCLFRLGVSKSGVSEASNGGLHSANFIPDEKAIEYGTAIMAMLGIDG